jgi:IPT/TIG domain
VTGDFTSAPLRDGDPWTGARLQQGRVLLDGDWNLNIDAAARERRQLALEAIGPAGVLQGSTGFKITFAADGTLQIGAGSMWVGGLYAVNPATLAYSAQEAIGALPGAGPALVYLDAFVQEVQSAEDPGDLLDPALDAIDTTTRTRVAWRARAVPLQTPAPGCAGAAEALPTSPISSGQLDIVRTIPATTDDPCAPPDDSRGKLPDGLLRVEVLDSGTETTARFAWSYENGAAAVAATVAGATVTLAPSPSVTFFQNDLVEVSTLQRRADRLPHGPLFSVVNVAPGAAGSTVTLNPASTVTGAPSGLCLRRWDGHVVGAAGSVAATLGGADVGVAFTARPGNYLAGDSWVTQTRGSSADGVETLTAAPPNGTPHYIASLAVVDLTAKTVLSDCRPQFPSLTAVRGGCCTVELQPSDVSGGTSLTALLASYANQGPVTFCLAPGTYTLTEPLVLSPGLSGITLQGCAEGVVLQGPGQPGPGFTLGLIVLQGANSVTIRGVELSVPLVGFTPSTDAFAGLPAANQALLQAYANGLEVAIGISASNAASLVVKDCTFTFPDPGQANVFGAGIYATGTMDDVEITRCTFQTANPPVTVPFYDLAAGNQAPSPYQLTVGYLQVAILPEPTKPTLQPAQARAILAATAPSQLLQDFAIERCLFEGLTVPVLAITQLGTLRIDKNTVRNSYGGFWLYSITDPSQLILFDSLAIGNPQIFSSFGSLGAAALCDRIPPMATALARVLPTTPPQSAAFASRRILAPSAGEIARARQLFTAYYLRARGPGGPSGAAPAGTARAAAAAAGPAGVPTAAEPAEAAPAEAARAAAAAELPSVLNTIFRIPPGVIEPAIEVAETGTSVFPRLDLADCQVDAVIADSYSGAALIMADLAEDPLTFSTPIVLGPRVASAVVHGSRMRCRFPLGETALGFAFAEANVTGNVIANEVAYPTQPSQTLPPAYSLSLFQMAKPLGAPAEVVSGNILIDPPVLELAQQTWQPLNTVINFSVVPTVTGISPVNGPAPGGTTVTVTGTGFTAATSVNFGPAAGTTLTIQSDTQLTIVSPSANAAGASSVEVTVITPAGTSATSTLDRFSYT